MTIKALFLKLSSDIELRTCYEVVNELGNGSSNRNPWKSKEIHRIFTFCEHGLTTNLVSNYFREFVRMKNEIVLDPFVGSGTVLIEASNFANICIGIDSNPWAIMVSKAKTTMPTIEEDDFLEMIETIEDYEPLIPSRRLRTYHTNGQIEWLGRIRNLIQDLSNDKILGLVVFGKLADNFSRLKQSPAPRFRKTSRYQRLNTIADEFKKKFLEAIHDIRGNNGNNTQTELILADSSTWIPTNFDGILTSPPFANNIDYIRHTQLYLLWSGIADSSSDLGKLRGFQIPACEAAARCLKNKSEKRWIIDKISVIDPKRSYQAFLLEYFYSMEKHFEFVEKSLNWEAWYTIGDSFFNSKYIPTHKLLKKLAEEIGLKTKLQTIGFRPGGRKLYLLKLIAN